MATINWPFLSSSSPEFYWWFGAFLGDGCNPAVRSRLTLVGSRSTTERWQALVTNTPGKLYEHKHSPGTFVASVGSVALSDWMYQTHGYRGPKSKTLRWPEEMPDSCASDFIRGLWDTDGCLYVQDKAKRKKSGNPARSLIYTSIAVPFVERLAQEIERLMNIPAPKLNLSMVPETGNPRAQLVYTGAKAQVLADWLYEFAPEHIRNEDRMEVYRRMALQQTLYDKPCACGKESYADGKCHACWAAEQPHRTGPGTFCATPGCGREVWANGLCVRCRSRESRAAPDYVRPAQGLCLCGLVAYRKGLCDACYERRRRGRPTRFETAPPAKGWASRRGDKIPGRPRQDAVGSGVTVRSLEET